ncbi:MAG: ATP-binding protein [Tissierellia bacterium]|nr:ATP-binding protein [Tissierellia bacterium]
MDRIISNLILYGKNENANILRDLRDLYGEFRLANISNEEIRQKLSNIVKNLLEISTDYGFEENLWQSYLTYVLITDENPFTLVTERKGFERGSVEKIVKNDLNAFYKLFYYDFSTLENTIGTNFFEILTNYTSIQKPDNIYNKPISLKVSELRRKLTEANNVDKFFSLVNEFYKNIGVGKIALNPTFRIETNGNDVELIPITNMIDVRFENLIGYESQKAELIENTQFFVDGKSANNVLLYGDSGTGKSTSIKATINEFYKDGLRMIEIYKHQLEYLAKVIGKIKNRNYKFIIYMDDLSFEEFETDYKYLKSIIEGGLESKPSNVLIYATSNRRHLIKETWSDRDDMEIDGEIHKSDNLEEKLSLSSRFGITIGYFKPLQKGYLEIVRGLAERNNISMDVEELEAEAIKWERHNGGRSGRTAEQFIRYLKSKN